MKRTVTLIALILVLSAVFPSSGVMAVIYRCEECGYVLDVPRNWEISHLGDAYTILTTYDLRKNYAKQHRPHGDDVRIDVGFVPALLDTESAVRMVTNSSHFSDPMKTSIGGLQATRYFVEISQSAYFDIPPIPRRKIKMRKATVYVLYRNSGTYVISIDPFEFAWSKEGLKLLSSFEFFTGSLGFNPAETRQ